MKVLPVHKMLQTLSWLQGIWVTDGVANGSYPNIKPFTYYDEINITSIGQPMFNYIAQSWHPETGEPMHRDTGFLQILPESNMIVLSLIDNLGLFTVEQGKLSDDNKSFDISSSNVLTTAASISPFSSLIQVWSYLCTSRWAGRVNIIDYNWNNHLIGELLFGRRVECTNWMVIIWNWLSTCRRPTEPSWRSTYTRGIRRQREGGP